jgi:MSHA biogenesis protein MshQ
MTERQEIKMKNMLKTNFWMRVWMLLALSAFAQNALAAVCTSIASGNWNTTSTWSCTGTTTRPGAGDTVIIVSPHTVTLDGDRSAANLTIDSGATLSDGNNRDLTVSGSVVINGTYNGAGNGGNLIMTGDGQTLSGTGTVIDIGRIQIDADITIPVGSSLNLTQGSEIRVGDGNPATLTIDGTITGTGQDTGNRILRVDNNNASNVIINGTIDAPNSYVEVQAGGTVTNNGTVTVQYLDGDNAATATWTQGADSSLTLSQPAQGWTGTFNADANGNTVTYNGTSTVIAPSAGYWNLAGTIFPGACPVAYTVNGSNPCPVDPGAGSVVSSPSSCSNQTGVGSVAWTPTPTTNVNLNDTLYATATMLLPATSNYLNCTGYNFSAVPTGATITGITVTVVRKASLLSSARDAFVYLIKDVAGAGVIQTAFNGATATNYTTTDVAEAHGGGNILWGTTWTDADVKAVNFGVAFSAVANLVGTISVNHVQVRVHYTTNPLAHVAINAPANAMALAEVPVVITPHTPAHLAITAAGTINLSTSNGTGDWTVGTGTGMLTPGAANSGMASYTFGAGESSVTLGFISQTAGTVTLNVSDVWGRDLLLGSPVTEIANSIVFTIPNFVFTDSACVHNIAFGAPGQTCMLKSWSPQVAGQAAANVYITAVNTAGVPTRLSRTRTRTRNMAFGLSCHDPVANAGMQATFAGATSVTLPLCQANGAIPAAWSATTVAATFPAGIPSAGPFSFNYPDVGKVELWMRNSAATTQRGASGPFVVKPDHFVITGIKCTTINVANCGAGALAMPTSGDNPAAANAAGVTFIRAGHPFTVTVTAKNALGNTTPNYGQETAAESVKLNPALVAGLGLANNPAIGGTFGTFTNGVATGAAFTWNEVGIITLTPGVADADYLGAGDATGTESGNVGRFYAGSFALSGGVIANRSGLAGCAAPAGCGSFTYMGEQMSAAFNLTAKAVDGTTTLQNYKYSATAANNFARFDPAAAGNPLALAAVDTGTPRTVATLDTATYGAASGSFSGGVATVTAPFAVTRGASPSGPFEALDIGVNPVDGDGAALALLDLAVNAGGSPDTHGKVGSTKARYGRLKISNAHGSELLPLTIAVTAQYWDGATYITNALDNNSSFAAGDVIFSNPLKNLVVAEISVSSVSAINNGNFSYVLAKPSGGDGKYDGSVDMNVNALSGWLPGNTARAAFGVYKGNNEFIYMREVY